MSMNKKKRDPNMPIGKLTRVNDTLPKKRKVHRHRYDRCNKGHKQCNAGENYTGGYCQCGAKKPRKVRSS